MGLVVWLPLTKDLRQQGLSNVTVTNSNATIDSAGKLGNCYYFNGSNARISCSSQTWDYPLSICGWFKPTDVTNSNTQYWLSYNTASGGTAGHAIGIGTFSGKFGIWYGGTQYYSFTQTLSNDVWYHIAVTITANKTVSTYLNGELIDSRTFSSNNPGSSWFTLGARSNSSTGGVGGALYFYKGYMNDARLYDHCLSLMEVKELAKGLVLHYPLNRQGWGQENLVWNSNWNVHSTTPPESWVNWGSPPTREIVTIDGKNWLHVISNTTQFQGYSQNWTKRNGVGELTANTKMTVSFTAKLATAASIAPIGIHWCNSSGTIVTQNWTTTALTTNPKRYSFTYTTPADCVAFNIMVGDNTNTAHEVWVTDIKLEFGEIATPWCPNSSDAFATTMGLNGTTEYDCSGFYNNGNKGGNTISYTSNTPKYAVSTQLTGTTVDTTSNTKTGAAYITGPCSLSNITALTVSWWAKIKKYGRGGIMDLTSWTSNYEEGTDYNTCPLSNWDSTFRLWDGTNAFNFFSYVLKDSAWHHYAVTFTSGSGKFYRDGVNVANSGTMGNTLTNFNGVRTGLGKAGGVYRQIDEDVSDLRIYATALSADDVKSLYQNCATIDPDGTIRGQIRS